MNLAKTKLAIALVSAITIVIVLINAASVRQPDRGESPPAQTDGERLTQFFEDVFDRRVAQSPILQSSLGRRTDQQGEWDNFSDEFAAAKIADTRAELETLRNEFDYEALPADDRLSYDLFVFDAKRAINNFEFSRNHYIVDQFNGQLSGLLTVLQNNHPIASLQDAEDYIARIAGLERVLHQFTVKLKDRAEYGVIAPAFSFTDVINDARSMSSGAPIDESSRTNAVYADFRKKLDNLNPGAAAKDDLTSRAAAALVGPYASGFATLIAEIERQASLAEGDNGVWALPNGDAFYRNRINHHTTLDLTSDDIHAIGLREVARLHAEMLDIRDAVGFNGDLQDFFRFIREDPNNYYADSDAGREQFLADARAQIDGIYAVVDDYFARLPRATLEVRRVEPWRENSTSIAFYNRPSEDGSRPGIYYANLADMRNVQKYVFSAITYHESVPGHHFQIALAQELEGLPSFRKYSGFGAFTEGWALYAEQLAKEMGFYKNPYHDFGRLQNELWRSIRLVLDTGIHAKRWSREDAIDYFRDNSPLSDGDIVTEVERFFVNPGQALGYKIGMLKILELREQTKTSLGARFDLREFHEAVIGAGALPLSLLERQVMRYVADRQ